MNSFIKTKWKQILIVAIAILLIASNAIVGYFLYNTDQKVKSLNKETSDQKSIINNDKKKIDEISLALSQTEEGKKQLEGINSSLEQDKTKLASDNQQLNSQVSAAQSQLATAQSQLAAKQADLAKVNANLATQNAALANATKCVNLFATVQSQYNQFKSLMSQSGTYYDQAIAAYDAGDNINGDRLWTLSDKAYNDANTVFSQMDANMGILKSGKC